MKIARNTTSLRERLEKAKLLKKPIAPVRKEEKPVEQEIAASVGREAAKLRLRAKKAEEELEIMKGERDALKTEVETLRKPAKSWTDYEHIEKQKLLAKLPPELKKDAQSMSLNHLRLFAGKNDTGGKGGEGTGKTKSEATDFEATIKTGKTADINKMVEDVLAGKVAPPTVPVETK